ncbi:hypothetical protein KIPB_014633, partial [Kipferlia bialata]|eukprot:g14633.t1
MSTDVVIIYQRLIGNLLKHAKNYAKTKDPVLKIADHLLVHFKRFVSVSRSRFFNKGAKQLITQLAKEKFRGIVTYLENQGFKIISGM